MKWNQVMGGLGMSRLQKRILTGALAAGLVGGGAAIALAGPPSTFAPNEILKAADLNANFSDAHSRLSALEASPVYLESVSNATENGQSGQDLIYLSAHVDLTQGTWLVQGYAEVETTQNADIVQISLWDSTNSAEVGNSRSPISLSAPFLGPGCNGPNGECSIVALSTSSVITVTGTTTLRIKALRNGNSTIHMGHWGGTPVLLPSNRITALKLR